MTTNRSIATITGGDVWTPDGFLPNCTVHLAAGRIVGVEAAQPGRSPATNPDATVLDASDGYVIPGLVDIQVNGALGWSFQAPHQPHFDEIIDFHQQRGTTTLLPTLVTAPADLLAESLAALRARLDQRRDGCLPGIHLEGPFLAREKSGAHDPDALRLPDPALMQRLQQAGGDRLALVTLAPELPGAPELIASLTAAGVLVAAGHSAATYAEMQPARAAGLGLVTHAGNASDWPQRAPGPLGFLASEPGVVGSLLAAPDLAAGVIVDGFHFHPALLPPLLQLKGPDRLLLVSDASTIAGCPPGDYTSGGLDVTVHPQGFATSGRGGGWLAGSTITLLDAVQRSVELAGIPLHVAVHMAALGPARLLGIQRRKGHIRPGHDADLLILNRDLSLRQVLVHGHVRR